MRVFVTGATGLLGSQLVPHLRASGCEVLGDRAEPGAVRPDLTDAAQTCALLDGLLPEVIVNLAALTNVDQCEREPQSAYLANVRIVENLATWMAGRRSACHLVHLSTDQVYDGPGLHRESDIGLRNYYGFSKYAGELAAAAVAGSVLRTNFFGPSRRPGRASLSDWLIQSMSKGAPVTVFEDVHFTPLSLETLCRMLRRVLDVRAPGVFNLGSRGGLSKADFAFALGRAMGLSTATLRRGNSGEVPLLAYRPKNMSMDCTRFETVFGVTLPDLEAEIHSMKVAYDTPSA